MSSQNAKRISGIFFCKVLCSWLYSCPLYQLAHQPINCFKSLKTDVSATIQGHKRALTTANPMDSALAEHAINTGYEKLNGQMPKLLMPPPSSISIATWRAGTSVDNSSRERGTLPPVYDLHTSQPSTGWVTPILLYFIFVHSSLVCALFSSFLLLFCPTCTKFPHPFPTPSFPPFYTPPCSLLYL